MSHKPRSTSVTEEQAHRRLDGRPLEMIGAYTNTQTKTYFRCHEGHEWLAKPNAIFQGQGCPKCKGFYKTIEEINEQLKTRGIKCISEHYITSKTPLMFECGFGHQWQARPQAVLHQTGCPECSGSNGERITRTILEEFLNMPFPKKRPKWLMKATGKRLELDGYNEKHRIAFEYQGIQHFKLHGMMQSTNLDERQRMDALKAKACKEHGIKLIIVNYFKDLHNVDQIMACVKDAIKKTGIDLKDAQTQLNKNIYMHCPDLADMQSRAIDKGGQLISKMYFDAHTKLEFECKKGHRFKTIPNAIRRGQWCPACGGSKPLTLDICKADAHKRGEECLSDRYVNHSTHLMYRCAEGHEYSCTPKNYRKGRGCPECAKVSKANKRKHSIETIQNAAQQKGGKLLSTSYKNNNTKLLWECKNNHQWQAVYSSIQQGTWCPECSKTKSH